MGAPRRTDHLVRTACCRVARRLPMAITESRASGGGKADCRFCRALRHKLRISRVVAQRLPTNVRRSLEDRPSMFSFLASLLFPHAGCVSAEYILFETSCSFINNLPWFTGSYLNIAV